MGSLFVEKYPTFLFLDAGIKESLNKLSIKGMSASVIYLKQVRQRDQKKKNRKIKAKLTLVKQSVNNLPWKREQSKS